MLEPLEDAVVFETSVQVRSYELDSFGHVNHAVFLNYLEHARFRAFREAGWPYETILSRGWGVYVVRIEVDYIREARLGQRLSIGTWAHAFKRTSLLLDQEIRGDGGVVVARARVTAVFVDENRKPMRVPDGIRDGLSRRDPAPGGDAGVVDP